MSKFEIHLTRSHYDAIAIVATNTGERENPHGLSETDPVWAETGWSTRFDGGGNIHIPSDFVALYGEAAQWRVKGGDEEPALYALVVRDGWRQDPFRGGETYLRHRRFSSGEVNGLTNDGLDEIQSAFEWSYESDDEWEVVAKADVPEHVRKVMEKSIATVRELFGQGGDFFA